jgi:hypothetical protein
MYLSFFSFSFFSPFAYSLPLRIPSLVIDFCLHVFTCFIHMPAHFRSTLLILHLATYCFAPDLSFLRSCRPCLGLLTLILFLLKKPSYQLSLSWFPSRQRKSHFQEVCSQPLSIHHTIMRRSLRLNSMSISNQLCLYFGLDASLVSVLCCGKLCCGS